MQVFCFQTWAGKCPRPCAPQVERRRTEANHSALGVRPDSSALPDNHSCVFLCLYFVDSLSHCLGSQDNLSTLTDTKCFVIVWDAGFGTGGHQPAPARIWFSVCVHDSSSKHWRGLHLENLGTSKFKVLGWSWDGTMKRPLCLILDLSS